MFVCLSLSAMGLFVCLFVCVFLRLFEFVRVCVCWIMFAVSMWLFEFVSQISWRFKWKTKLERNSVHVGIVTMLGNVHKHDIIII